MKFFLEALKEDLGLTENSPVTWILDKQKGLELALQYHLDNPDHKHCIRNLYNNFKTNFKGGQLKLLMWGAAWASTKFK